MPVTIEGLSVFVSNSSRKAAQMGCVKIRNADGEVLASVHIPKSNALAYLQKHHDSSEAQELIVQLLGNDVPMTTIRQILKPRPSSYELRKLMRSA